MTPPARHTGPGLLRALAGLIVWAVFFVVIYALLSVGCAIGADAVTARVSLRDPLTLTLLAAFGLHLLVLAAMLGASARAWRAHRRSPDGAFVRRLTVLLDTVGLFGVLWVGFPVLLLPPCP